MNIDSLFTLHLLAAQAEGAKPGGIVGMLPPMLLMMVIFYFLLIRPQKKKQKELEMQIAAMKVGDKIVTAGGMHGMIANLKDTTAVVKVADNVKIEFDKGSIATVINKGSSEDDLEGKA